jgi:hypothetical protein
MRLIDANEAYEIARTSAYYSCFGHSLADLTDLRELLEDCDTVDAVEVVHGRWELDTGDVYRCTNYNEKSHVKEVMGQPDWNYCPNCGAKMDGGADNGG